MRRRAFLMGVGGVAMWPIKSPAQQQRMPTVGYLTGIPLDDRPGMLVEFRRGLEVQGFVEGRNVAIEYRSAENRLERLPGLVADLIDRGVVVIVANGPAPSRAAQAASRTMPMVFVTGADPVRLGLVASLNRPGGNLTGVTFLAGELNVKRLQLLHTLVPKAVRIAILANPSNPISRLQVQDVEEAARQLGLKLEIDRASSLAELDVAFRRIGSSKPDALLINADPLFTSMRTQIVALASRMSLPVVYPEREAVQIGGLMSYGSSILAANRIVGEYTGRILKGERPADLPVQQSTTFELAINLKTAKAQSIEVPMTLLATANEVIE